MWITYTEAGAELLFNYSSSGRRGRMGGRRNLYLKLCPIIKLLQTVGSIHGGVFNSARRKRWPLPANIYYLFQWEIWLANEIAGNLSFLVAPWMCQIWHYVNCEAAETQQTAFTAKWNIKLKLQLWDIWYNILTDHTQSPKSRVVRSLARSGIYINLAWRQHLPDFFLLD